MSHHPPLHPVRHALRNLAGVGLVLLGIVGLFLPFLQGVLFLVLGLSLIDHPWKRAIHVVLKRSVPPYRWLALKHHRVKRGVRHRLRTRRHRRAAKD